ncbi:MAG: hypothetical protein MI700_00280 [Balneolales bacterium]|nr:hypothetical protein [Balneolales bacterium]
MNVQQSKTPYLLLLAFCLIIAAVDAFSVEDQSQQTVTIKVDSSNSVIMQEENHFFTHVSGRTNP